MERLRIVVIVAVIGLATPPLMLLQAAFMALKLPLVRWLPVAYHRLVCRMMGVRITVKGSPSHMRPLLLASNHISWLDIPVISAVAPVSFIAKSEVGEWPVVGWLARLQRTVFVTRERRSQTGAVARHIADRLEKGDAIVLFPEGTTSDGNRIRAFRSALVGAAESLVADGGDSAAIHVQPMAIAYTRINGLPLGRQHRPLIAWYGDQALGPHLSRLLRTGPVDVTVSFGDPIAAADGGGRKQITAAAQSAVGELFATALYGHPAQGIVVTSLQDTEAETAGTTQ
ncbi:MAG: 1-acyl-sn-glycerol-3-phosphate acyltransferase [Rhodobiaceae bacterium]|nr:1-acyl-sn-glycerol-3-phosphate acyltransferase [Rhodobiaceae bacterium]MCC0012637.1 1-acyl-sn-glycerol-3-phosphate acyltransferase [Rhodobiaceae bacterium]MCC0018056.1 1-acyl-sn-glycerol-3-phosphate acyltransferase [Rhodobiaceae bacterium]MCC0061845.1 1-acyl-sn-glycerol-3-phosphate acyltransferase [Rhodobiaceae bacterium]